MRHRTVAKAADRSNLLARLTFFLGFSLPFPGLLLPNATSSPRYTDLAVALCIPFAWSLYNRTIRNNTTIPFVLAWQAAILVPAVVHYLTFGSFVIADYVYYVRWILAIALAAPLAQVMPGNQRLQRAFLLGIVVGASFHILTIWFASIGGKPILLQIGFASPRVKDTTYFGETRITSLSEHANNAMILIAMSVPAAVSYRLVAPRDKGLWIIGVSLVLLIIGFYFTLTRSATLGAFIAIAVGVLQFFKRSEKSAMWFRATFVALAAVMVLLAIQLSTFEVGQDRLAERIASKGLDKNLAGRLHTIEATIDLLMHHPLGTGWSQFLKRITLADGLTATHNGYLFTARIMGVPLLLLIVIGHARLLWRVASTRRVDALPPLICFLLVVMFAEDVTQGMSMVFLVIFMAFCGYKFAPWASTLYRSVLVPPAAPVRGSISPGRTTGVPVRR